MAWHSFSATPVELITIATLTFKHDSLVHGASSGVNVCLSLSVISGLQNFFKGAP